MEYCYVVTKEDELKHYGVKGMRWGVRRFQNPDGSLTSSGRAHYTDEVSKLKKKSSKLRDKAKKYEKKSSRWYRTREGHVKYNKKKARKMVKAYKKDAKAAKIEAAIKNASVNKNNVEKGKDAMKSHKGFLGSALKMGVSMYASNKVFEGLNSIGNKRTSVSAASHWVNNAHAEQVRNETRDRAFNYKLGRAQGRDRFIETNYHPGEDNTRFLRKLDEIDRSNASNQANLDRWAREAQLNLDSINAHNAELWKKKKRLF